MKTQGLQEHGGENKNNLPKPVVGVTKRVKEKLEFSSQKEKKRQARGEHEEGKIKGESKDCRGRWKNSDFE